MHHAAQALTIGEYDLDDSLIAEVLAGGEVSYRVYPIPRTMVVMGRGSRASVELHEQNCLVDAVDVRRRRGGGCSVVLDPGNLVVAVVAPVGGLADNGRWLRFFSQWLIDGLGRSGIAGVSIAGICDLVRDGRKISGACLYRNRDFLYYCATLLVEPRFELIARYLRHPPREPSYRAGRSHRTFLGRVPFAGGAAALALQLTEALSPLSLREIGDLLT